MGAKGVEGMYLVLQILGIVVELYPTERRPSAGWDGTTCITQSTGAPPVVKDASL